MDFKNRIHLYATYKKFISKTYNISRLQVKGWGKMYHRNIDHEKAGMALLISNKVNFKANYQA